MLKIDKHTNWLPNVDAVTNDICTCLIMNDSVEEKKDRLTLPIMGTLRNIVDAFYSRLENESTSFRILNTGTTTDNISKYCEIPIRHISELSFAKICSYIVNKDTVHNHYKHIKHPTPINKGGILRNNILIAYNNDIINGVIMFEYIIDELIVFAVYFDNKQCNIYELYELKTNLIK